MKRLTFVLLALLLLMLAGCSVEEKPTPTWNVKAEFSSDTSAEDCYLCGGGIENLVPSYWGQNNVAFISLKTFEIAPLEINRYDKTDGHLIEEYAGLTTFEGGSGADGGFSATLLIDHNRGYARGELDFYNDETLDIDKAATFLCTDCLNKIFKPTEGPYFGVGLIDLETKKIHAFGKRFIGFELGDYVVFCQLQEQENSDTLRMNLLISNSPRRYGDPPLNEWRGDVTSL